MGMTIDKAIEIINHYPDYPKEEVKKALVFAIETMRKYQQIEQIYQKWIEVNDFSYNQAMSQIGVVLEGGNNNL